MVGTSAIDRYELRLQRLGSLAIQDVGVAVNGNDPRDRIFGRGQTLTLQNGAERDIPRLIANFGGYRALDIFADDDCASRECRERRDDIANVGILERYGDRRLLRLLGLREERDRLVIG